MKIKGSGAAQVKAPGDGLDGVAARLRPLRLFLPNFAGGDQSLKDLVQFALQEKLGQSPQSQSVTNSEKHRDTSEKTNKPVANRTQKSCQKQEGNGSITTEQLCTEVSMTAISPSGLHIGVKGTKVF